MIDALHNKRALIAGAAAIAVIAASAGFGLGQLTRAPAPPAASTAGSADHRPLYWYDPMNPSQHFDHPGKSPYMDMQLVPKYADDAPSGTGVKIDPDRLQTLGVRTAVVERGKLETALDAPAVVEFNQRGVAVVQARAAGFVQHVYGRAPGDVLRRGDPVVDVLVPSWNGAAAEYLALSRQGDAALTAAARQRLRLLGMPDEAIERLVRTGKAPSTLTVTAPVAGAVQSLDVRQGMTVASGQTLIQIAPLSPIWLTLSLPESVAAMVKVGDRASASLTAFPGERFDGRVSAILPAAQADSRTVQARIEIANPSGRLKPSMYAVVHLQGAAREGLLIPAESVIRTGKRAIVMLAGDGGRFQPAEVTVGRESNGRIEVLAGLSEGQKVVASGQFLIDSEASLAGLTVKPLAGAPAPAPAAQAVDGHGVIEALKGDEITLSHDAIPALGWPAMTMSFAMSPSAIGKGFKPGDHVRFMLDETPQGPVVRRLERMESVR